MTAPEVRAPLRHLLGVRRWNEKEIVACSAWRQSRNSIAAQCPAKRRKTARQRKKLKRALSY
ncbi:MAG: hypothetical protein SGJ19_08310 [Planctomycetia bacterium]|nr:hypothetical protein [Planctomycetia bacterium]